MREGQGERRGLEKVVRFFIYNIRNGRNGGLVCALQAGAGKGWLWSDAGCQANRQDLQKGVKRIPGDGNGGAKCSSQWRRGFLPQGVTLFH